MRPENLVEVRNLQTHFFTDRGIVKAVDGVSFAVPKGKTIGIVGESGSGKSITARSLMSLIDPPGRIVSGEILLERQDGQVIDIARLDPFGSEIRAIRGADIALIFQEPMAALSPVHTIGNQIIEMIQIHEDLDDKAARDKAIEMLRRVDMPKAEQRIDAYTFELSGGMRQRAMIAMALACRPRLVIADEPTTALDVTTQATILDLLRELQERDQMSVMFITHDLGVVAEIADEVAVMYLGRVVERGPVDEIFEQPMHPYTRALIRSIPKLGVRGRHRLEAISGMVPHPSHRPQGCPFHDRCPEFMPGVCDRIVPPVEKIAERRDVSCLLHSDVEALKAASEQETTSDE
ncbi:MAG: ABC transporter ATP-binding protein [Spirochaetaceae bacterium]|nr:MAG: ABC transporter ATP-binding protein [Spirochaetaceae bacterium]